MNTLEFLNNLAASTVSMMRGIAAEPAAAKPSQPLQLYEMEGCPYCRIVREALTALDIDAVIYPCPRDGLRFRPLVRETGGKEQFPFLVDPNTGVTMYESLDIVDYLYATYAGRASIPTLGLRTVHLPTSFAASLLRAGKGIRKRDAKVPAELLDLWSFEGSPFARPVRELLCELEIPYRLHNAGRTVWQDWLLPPLRERVVPDYQPTEANRKDLLARAGRVQVPYLFDANTGTGLFESVAILRYLRQTYQR